MNEQPFKDITFMGSIEFLNCILLHINSLGYFFANSFPELNLKKFEVWLEIEQSWTISFDNLKSECIVSFTEIWIDLPLASIYTLKNFLSILNEYITLGICVSSMHSEIVTDSKS